jgi:hypothetical protein
MPANWLAGFELLSQDDVTDQESLIRYSFLDYRRAQT